MRDGGLLRSAGVLRSLASVMVLAPVVALASGCSPEEELSPASAPSGPLADIELVQDRLGITHIYAKSDADAFFGEGYSMARDRLFQMELNRRQALGTRAEVLGEGALNGDIASRTMNFAKLGELDAELLGKEHPEDLAMVEAFVAGVNYRIEEIEKGDAPRPYGLRASELDLVPEKWTAAHAFAIGKTLAFGLSNTLDYDMLATAIRRISPDAAAAIPLGLPAFDTAILQDVELPAPPAPPGPSIAELGAGMEVKERLSFKPIYPRLGSNNWAVDGAHTENGKPLLAGDPHQALTSPSRLWPTHLNSADEGGSLDVIGFAFVGTPGVQLGHNARVGWTATTNYADVMDIWEVKAGGSFESVKLGGETHAIVTRTEQIAVKGGEAVSVDVHEVPGFGVILPDEVLPVPRAFLADDYILFNWIGFESGTKEASSYFAIDRAANVDEFDAAVDLLDVGAVNFVAADEEAITYHVHTHVPDRGEPSSRPMPWHLVSGEDPENFWTRGFLADELLPQIRDPKSGFIVTANNDPYGFMADGSAENDAFYYGSAYATGFRAHRIRELLEERISKGKVTREDMEEIQRDVRQPLVDSLVPPLVAAVDAIGTDVNLAEFEGRADLVALAKRLEKWDGRFTRESDEAVVFFAFQWFAARRTLEGPFTPILFDAIADASQPYFLGQLRNVMEGRFPGASALLPGGKGKMLLGALDDTAKWLKERFGGIDAPYAWRDVHAAELRPAFGEALAMPQIRRDGGIDTVNVSDCGFFDGNGETRESFVSHDGSVYRLVIGFGDDGRPRGTIDFSQGTSGEPGDPHFDDANVLWAEAKHTLLPFEKGDVEANVEARVTIPAR